VNKYHVGKIKRTLKRELKELEVVEMEAIHHWPRGLTLTVNGCPESGASTFEYFWNLKSFGRIKINDRKSFQPISVGFMKSKRDGRGE